jgi:hypothetical protein
MQMDAEKLSSMQRKFCPKKAEQKTVKVGPFFVTILLADILARRHTVFARYAVEHEDRQAGNR